MGERRQETTTAVAEPQTARARYDQARDQVQALHQRLRSLQGTSPFERTDHEEDALIRLERQIAEREALLPSLEAASRQERAQVDVQALEDDWEPLRLAKVQLYDELAQLVRDIWNKAAEIATVHGQQETLLQGIPDAQVRAYMLSTFWIDRGTMRTRMAGNMYPPESWHTFFNNAIGLQAYPGSTIGGNDPGTSAIPPMVVSNVQNGVLFATAGHRG